MVLEDEEIGGLGQGTNMLQAIAGQSRVPLEGKDLYT